MFSLEQKFKIHTDDVQCGQLDQKGPRQDSVEKTLLHFKWGKKALPLLAELKARGLVDGSFIAGTNFYIIDFLKFSITRDAPGQPSSSSDSVSKKIIPVLKKLREQKFFLPECFVYSKLAKSYLCSQKISTAVS